MMTKNDDKETVREQLSIDDTRMAFDVRRALLEDVDVPDAEKEFEQFKATRMQLPKRQRAVVRPLLWGAVAAACVAMFFLLVPSHKAGQEPAVTTAAADGETVYKAMTPTKDIALTVDGKSLALHSAAARQQGVTVDDDDMITFLSPEKVAPEDRTTLTIPQGQVAAVRLPDGTKVWLSACSQLVFPRRFPKTGSREVRLMGEAYFEVAHDKEHPFIVHSHDLSTTVLGTVFNIRSFEQEPSRVTLVSGSVRVAGSSNRGVVLTPGQEAALTSDGRLAVGEADVEKAVSWREGLFLFDGETLREIMMEVGRWYNLNVVFDKTEHMNDRLHFSGERKSDIRQIIRQISLVSETRIRVEGNNLLID